MPTHQELPEQWLEAAPPDPSDPIDWYDPMRERARQIRASRHKQTAAWSRRRISGPELVAYLAATIAVVGIIAVAGGLS